MTDKKITPPPAPAPAAKSAPTLKFGQPQTVKVGQLFNTYRLGDKWADAVQEGDVVNLANTEGEVFGTAEVVSVHSGQWEGVKQFASDNHEVSQFAPAEAAELLYDNLRRYYPDDVKANSRFAVLYLRRVS